MFDPERRTLAGEAAPRMETLHRRFTVNGETVEVAFAPHKTLLELLREDLGLTGTKHGCELGECGTCTVRIDKVPVLSCLVLAAALDEHQNVETVEGMASPAALRLPGEEGLHPLQEAFAELGAAQCGYCTPGFLMTAEALLEENPRPSRDDIREALSGNLCRCTGYVKIYQAVEAAAAVLRGEHRTVREALGNLGEEVLYGQRG